jgi:hypothetical protein
MDVNITRVLLFFYIIIASNFSENLFSKQLRTFFDENRPAQHLIGFIMMLTFVMIIGGVTDIEKGLLFSVLGYLWFVFTTKLDIQWNIMILLLLLFGFIYESKLSEKEQEIMKDQSLSEEEKRTITDSYQSYKMWLFGGIISVTVIGSLLYINKKDVQYGGGYNMLTFLFY